VKPLNFTNENCCYSNLFDCRKVARFILIPILNVISNSITQPLFSLARLPSFPCKCISSPSFQLNAFLPHFLSPSISHIPTNPGDCLNSRIPETASASQSPQKEIVMEFQHSQIVEYSQLLEIFETDRFMNLMPQPKIHLNILNGLAPALNTLIVGDGNLYYLFLS